MMPNKLLKETAIWQAYYRPVGCFRDRARRSLDPLIIDLRRDRARSLVCASKTLLQSIVNLFCFAFLAAAFSSIFSFALLINTFAQTSVPKFEVAEADEAQAMQLRERIVCLYGDKAEKKKFAKVSPSEKVKIFQKIAIQQHTTETMGQVRYKQSRFGWRSILSEITGVDVTGGKGGKISADYGNLESVGLDQRGRIKALLEEYQLSSAANFDAEPPLKQAALTFKLVQMISNDVPFPSAVILAMVDGNAFYAAGLANALSPGSFPNDVTKLSLKKRSALFVEILRKMAQFGESEASANVLSEEGKKVFGISWYTDMHGDRKELLLAVFGSNGWKAYQNANKDQQQKLIEAAALMRTAMPLVAYVSPLNRETERKAMLSCDLQQ